MSSAAVFDIAHAKAPSSASRLEKASFVLFLVALAWAPFPLGSNRPWSWSLLCIVISICWLLWLASVWSNPRSVSAAASGLQVPIALAALALTWGLVQVLPIVPQAWSHPVWQLADGILGRHTSALVSLNGWRSETELMKLASYAMAAWLARVHGQRSDRARNLLDAIVVIGACYAAYAVVMASLKMAQFNLFYAVSAHSHDLSGPFVNRNSYATYGGLIALCAAARLIEVGAAYLAPGRNVQQLAMQILQYVFGRGLLYLIVAVMALSTVLATTSRAGTLAALAGIAALVVLMALLSRRHWPWVAGIGFAAVIAVVVLIAVNGDNIAARFDDLATPGDSINLRLMLWDAALRMIRDAPLLGLGLGTYQDAYPMYSDTMTIFVMDRAHNDYLEFAAGLGLPAAFLWWAALGFLTVLCARGAFIRRRNRSYPMLTVAATVLVALHSAFDFSLQMPAIALTYAAILGLGVAQSFSTRRGENG